MLPAARRRCGPLSPPAPHPRSVRSDRPPGAGASPATFRQASPLPGLGASARPDRAPGQRDAGAQPASGLAPPGRCRGWQRRACLGWVWFCRAASVQDTRGRTRRARGAGARTPRGARFPPAPRIIAPSPDTGVCCALLYAHMRDRTNSQLTKIKSE